jgi:hypothetical protein
MNNRALDIPSSLLLEFQWKVFLLEDLPDMELSNDPDDESLNTYFDLGRCGYHIKGRGFVMVDEDRSGGSVEGQEDEQDHGSYYVGPVIVEQLFAAASRAVDALDMLQSYDPHTEVVVIGVSRWGKAHIRKLINRNAQALPEGGSIDMPADSQDVTQYDLGSDSDSVVSPIRRIPLFGIDEGHSGLDPFRGFGQARRLLTDVYALDDLSIYGSIWYREYHRGIVVLEERGTNSYSRNSEASLAEAQHKNLFYYTPRVFKRLFIGEEAIYGLFHLVDSYVWYKRVVVVVVFNEGVAVYLDVPTQVELSL